mgnify:CR=1 FL=1
MINKFQSISCLVVTLLLTNYFGWTSIPWILIKIPAAIIGVLWIWAIVVATVMIIVNGDIK